MQYKPGVYWAYAKKNPEVKMVVQITGVDDMYEIPEQNVEFFQTEVFENLEYFLRDWAIICPVDTPTLENQCNVIARDIVGGITISTIGLPNHFETIIFGDGPDKRFDYCDMVSALVHHGRLVERFKTVESIEDKPLKLWPNC